MQGYLNDISLSLNEDEMQRYKTYYCRVCNALSLRYGFRYRALVNYDVVAYMIITKLATGDEFYCFNYPCQAKHIRGLGCFKSDSLGQFFAALVARGMSVAVEDKIQDGDKSFRYKFLSFFFRKAFKPHDEKEKILYEKVSRRMRELLELERQNSRDINLYLEYYADSVLMCIDEYYPDIPEAYRTLIFQIARFVDYMDMIEDYDDDIKEGAFNPLVSSDSPTARDYVGRHWQDIFAITHDMSAKMDKALFEIKPKERVIEWDILAKLVKYAIPRSIEKIVTGAPVKMGILRLD